MTTHELPCAETVNYWKTSKSSPDKWLERAHRQIESLGGEVLAEGFGSEPGLGRAAYMLAFEIRGERYKAVWPVLPSKSGDAAAARIQAATFLYHDIKSRALSAVILGPRTAFFSYLMLPDGSGRTMADVSTPELTKMIPALLTSSPGASRESRSDNIVDGSVVEIK